MKENKYIDDLFHGTQGSTFTNAKFLRQRQTKAEEILWNELRSKKLKGYKFRRQHPISSFVVDFYCAEKKLAVEIDGSIHNEREIKYYDKDRSEELNKFGITVVRFDNEELLDNMHKVLDKILRILEDI